jgi:protocatechuate 3,4-dioxygenase beta subunit
MPTASTTIEEPKKHQAPIHWPVLQRIDSLRVVDLRVHQAHTWFGKDSMPAPMTDGPFYPPTRWRERWNRLGRRPDPGAPQDGQTVSARASTWALALRWSTRAGPADRPRRGRDLAMRRAGAVPPPRRGRRPGRFDPGFQGFGAARSGSDGALRFRTIRPVPYPGRTPHIHVKLRHASFGELTSQLVHRRRPRQCARLPLARSWPPPTASRWRCSCSPATDSGLRWQVRHALVVPA